MEVSFEEAVRIVASSLLFDEAWYRKTYRVDAKENAAAHYLTEGYAKGWNPSQYFSTEMYLLENPNTFPALFYLLYTL